MAGNYGGNSIPTTPVGGDLITTAAYANYKCTSVYATTASAVFIYNGVTINLPVVGDSIDLLMSSGGISGTDAKAVFLCYECDPCGVNAFTGTTAPSSYYDGFSGSPMNRPTIIGGGGLNN
tara:strand:- start:442 stop:804 length:363 start_codon:yes stop_codon:yes gene_type:complete